MPKRFAAPDEREVGRVDDVADVWVSCPGHPVNEAILVRTRAVLDARQARVLAALLLDAARQMERAQLRRARLERIARRT